VKLMICSAMAREDSTCYILARQIEEMAVKHGCDVDFVTPASVGLPVNDGNVDWSDPKIVAWQEQMAGIEAHIWVSPEYHSGMTGGLKNLFDYLTKAPMKDDVVGFAALAGGAMAALNTLNGMTTVARSLGAWVAPQMCALNSNDVKAGLSEKELGRIEDMVVTVIDAARRLQSVPEDLPL
jgi:azobenzene reductase